MGPARVTNLCVPQFPPLWTLKPVTGKGVLSNKSQAWDTFHLSLLSAGERTPLQCSDHAI